MLYAGFGPGTRASRPTRAGYLLVATAGDRPGTPGRRTHGPDAQTSSACRLIGP